MKDKVAEETLHEMFWEPTLQNMEELAHDLYGCMNAHLMRLLGEEAAKHPKMATNLNDLSGETYGAMLNFARRILIDRHKRESSIVGESDGGT